MIPDTRQVDLEGYLSTSKRCLKCGNDKDRSQFTCARSHPDGLQSYCRPCAKAEQRAWHKANPQANGAYKRKAYLSDPAKPILRSIRIRAKASGIPCDLSFDDVRAMLMQTKVCPVLGIPLAHRVSGKREGPADHAPSIDRRRPELGYVRGNVAVISQRANRLKNNATVEEVRRILVWMETTTVVENSNG